MIYIIIHNLNENKFHFNIVIQKSLNQRLRHPLNCKLIVISVIYSYLNINDKMGIQFIYILNNI